MRDQLAREVKDIGRRLHRVSPLPVDPSLRAYIAIDPPRTSSEVNQISRAYLISSDRKTTRSRDDYAESKGWADAYLLTRDIGYVFAAPEICQLVYIAAERIIRDKYGVRMPTTMLAYAKQDLNDISQLKKRLANTGYYTSLPYDIRPLPRRLEKADILQRADSLVNRLVGYQGPVFKEAKSALLNSERVVDWLRQFRRDDLIEAALQMLGEIKLIGRDDIDSALRDFMAKSPEYRKGFICRFGAEKDSSSVIAYYAQDVAGDYELTVGSVTDALSVEDAPIVFVDDFIGSGGQAKYILEHWLNVVHSVELNEERGPSLSDDMQAVLKKRRLGFVFAAGTKSGAEALSEKISELNLNGKVHVQIDSSTLPRAFDRGLYGSGAKEAMFRSKCASIGKALLADKKAAGHSTKWISERTLGYGNDAFLVVFPYNTPSQTLTCLWKSGKVGDAQWLPLFPRREKV